MYERIDRLLVSGRKRIPENGIVCQKQESPLCCGLLRGGQNEEEAMSRAIGTDHGGLPEIIDTVHISFEDLHGLGLTLGWR
jgi:hypothetical protein